jgi:hypothetical protein
MPKSDEMLSTTGKATARPHQYEAKPCPFCGSTRLQPAEWCVGDCEMVEAIECADCYAGAPVAAWQRRAGEASA